MSAKTHAARMRAIQAKRGRKPLIATGRFTVDEKGRKIFQIYGPKQVLEQKNGNPSAKA
jgi:hypothetical protein